MVEGYGFVGFDCRLRLDWIGGEVLWISKSRMGSWWFCRLGIVLLAVGIAVRRGAVGKGRGEDGVWGLCTWWIEYLGLVEARWLWV